MTDRYVLRGHDPVPCEDLMEWGARMQNGNRRVAITNIGKNEYISTVFLGLDHSFGTGAPVLFETLVFGGQHDGDGERYHTWHQAVVGHARFVEKILGGAIPAQEPEAKS